MSRQSGLIIVIFAFLAALPPDAGAQQPAKEKLVTLSVKDMDIQDVLEMFSVQRKLSIVASNGVTGKVTVNLFNLTEDEALEAILGANGYVFTRKGRVIYVDKPPESVPTKEAVFHLKWATAADMVTLLGAFSSKDGKVVKAEAGDTVVVNDTEEVIAQMERIVKELDKRPRQVMIESQMVEIGETSLKKLGFNWSSLDQLNVMELTLERSYRRDKTRRKTDTDPTAIELNRAVGSIASLRAGILDENGFLVLASLFNNMSDSHIVSQPRIMTINAKKASIIVGTVVPIPTFDFAKDTGVRTLSGFEDERIGTEIEVTPHIREDGYILLEVIPRVEEITDYITVDGDRQRPIKSTRSAETQVVVRDGNTVVIGGLRGHTRRGNTGRVPYLYHIPWIGGIFNNRTNDLQLTELIIFITPHIVEDENLSEHEKVLRDESSRFEIQPVWKKDWTP